jgi:hypothetical protein
MISINSIFLQHPPRILININRIKILYVNLRLENLKHGKKKYYWHQSERNDFL